MTFDPARVWGHGDCPARTRTKDRASWTRSSHRPDGTLCGGSWRICPVVRSLYERNVVAPESVQKVCVCVCVSGLRASAAGSMARVPQAVSGVSPDTPAGPLAPNHRPIMWRLGGGGVTDTDEMLLIISRTWWRSPVLSPPLSCPGLFNKQTIFVCKRGGGGGVSPSVCRRVAPSVHLFASSKGRLSGREEAAF